MKRLLAIWIGVLALGMTLRAETRVDRVIMPNEIRIG